MQLKAVSLLYHAPSAPGAGLAGTAGGQSQTPSQTPHQQPRPPVSSRGRGSAAQSTGRSGSKATDSCRIFNLMLGYKLQKLAFL